MIFDNIDALFRWYDQNRTPVVSLERNESLQSTEQSDTNATSSPAVFPVSHPETNLTTNVAKHNESNLSFEQNHTSGVIVVSKAPVETDTNLSQRLPEENLTISQAPSLEANITITNYFEADLNISECHSRPKLNVDFWRLLDQAMVRSAALILKKHDIRVTAANIDIIKSQLFPILSLRYQSEYYHGFSSGSSASIGGQYYPPISEYRDSLSLNLDYELYRFGAKGLKTQIAESELEIIKSEFALTQEQVANQLLQYYTDALKAQERIRYLEKVRLMEDTIVQKYGRLFDAGEVQKTQIMQSNIDKLTTQKTIMQSRQQLSRALRDIDILTGIKLDPAMVDLAMLEPGKRTVKSFEESAVARNLQLQIDKKMKEIALIGKDKLPSLYASGGYLLYGKDEDTPVDAIGAIERNNWSIGLNLRWNLFDGYKTDNSIKKAQEELALLKERYRLAKEDFEARKAKRAALKRAIDKILKEESLLLDAICRQKEMYEKLHKAGTATQLQADRTEISRLRNELSFKEQVIDRAFEEIADELVY